MRPLILLYFIAFISCADIKPGDASSPVSNEQQILQPPFDGYDRWGGVHDSTGAFIFDSMGNYTLVSFYKADSSLFPEINLWMDSMQMYTGSPIGALLKDSTFKDFAIKDKDSKRWRIVKN